MTDAHLDAPSAWLTAHRELLPRSGHALDVACGTGRHALWLAEQGLSVMGVDRNPAAIAAMLATARSRGLSVTGEIRDLETGAPALGRERFDLVVAVSYLHRPLFPHLIAALRPRGVLVYETFTALQASRGKPTNPDYLLEPGELVRLASPLEVLAAREGDYEGRFIASVVARRWAPPGPAAVDRW